MAELLLGPRFDVIRFQNSRISNGSTPFYPFNYPHDTPSISLSILNGFGLILHLAHDHHIPTFSAWTIVIIRLRALKMLNYKFISIHSFFIKTNGDFVAMLFKPLMFCGQPCGPVGTSFSSLVCHCGNGRVICRTLVMFNEPCQAIDAGQKSQLKTSAQKHSARESFTNSMDQP